MGVLGAEAEMAGEAWVRAAERREEGGDGELRGRGAGRVPRTKDLGCEAVGVELDAKGAIKVSTPPAPARASQRKSAEAEEAASAAC